MDLPHLTAGKRFTLPRPPLSADALLLAQLGMREKAAGRAPAVFTADANDAQRLIDEIAFFAPDLRCALFPDWDTLPDEELTRAAERPPGPHTFQLVSVTPFKPESFKGQKVEAKGLMFRAPNRDRLNVSSIQPVASSCSN